MFYCEWTLKKIVVGLSSSSSSFVPCFRLVSRLSIRRSRGEENRQMMLPPSGRGGKNRERKKCAQKCLESV